MLRCAILLVPAVLYAAPVLAQTAESCERLRALSLSNTVVTSVSIVSDGTFTPPGASAPNATLRNLPVFCRVSMTLTPTSDSEIKTEVWLPATGWNRRLSRLGMVRGRA